MTSKIQGSPINSSSQYVEIIIKKNTFTWVLFSVERKGHISRNVLFLSARANPYKQKSALGEGFCNEVVSDLPLYSNKLLALETCLSCLKSRVFSTCLSVCMVFFCVIAIL